MKSLLIEFTDEEYEKVIGAAADARESRRGWVKRLVLKEIEARERLSGAFAAQKTYVFKLKDGRVLQMAGMNPGKAWELLGFTMGEMDLVSAWKELEDAIADGWVKPGLINQATEVAMPDASMPEVLNKHAQELLDAGFEKPRLIFPDNSDLPFDK